MKKLILANNDNSVFFGVCGGLGKYFEIDPVFIRVIWVLLVLASGFGIIAYLIFWLAMPRGNND